MGNHTSKRLEMDSDVRECVCGHSDQRHYIQWLSRTFSAGNFNIKLPTPVVHCLECVEEEIAAQRVANRHSLEMARALQNTKPEAAVLVRMLEVSERIFAARERDAPQSEVDALMVEHDSLRTEAQELNLLGSTEPLGDG